MICIRYYEKCEAQSILRAEIKKEQAGAELCQAQYKLELAEFWFGSVASLKFDCLVQTGVVAIVNKQILCLDKCCSDKCCRDRCCMDKCCMDKCCMDKCCLDRCSMDKFCMVKLVLDHLSTVKDGSTSVKCPPWYFPWGWGVGGEKLKLMLTQSSCAGAGTELGNSIGESWGHYICDVKENSSNLWFRTNDNHQPVEISPSDVTKNGYVYLFKTVNPC